MSHKNRSGTFRPNANKKRGALSLLLLTACSSPGPVTQSTLDPSANHPKLTIERLFDDPDLNGPSPRALTVSPDGQRVTYLKEKDTDFLRLDLWEFDLSSGKNRILVDSNDFLKGEENLSSEEKGRRERLRIKSTGIVEYKWSEAGNALIFPLAGGLFYYPIGNSHAAPLQLTNGKHHETEPHLSRHGKYVSFVRSSDLYLIETASRKELRITHDGSEAIKNGIAEFIALEEMERFDGQWWSKDERRLAFTRTDESEVEISQRYEIEGDGFEFFKQRYPRTGTRNAKVRLGVVDMTQPKKVRWMDLGPESDIYLARVNWLPDGKTLAVQLQSRDQKKLELRFYDSMTGRSRLILSEADSKWLNLNNDLHFLKNSSRFIWASEKSGYKHLYLYDLQGRMIRQLTSGLWPVHHLLAINESEGLAYFTASQETPLEQHLYRVSLGDSAESKIEKITHEEGWHQISMPESARIYVDSFSNPTQPQQVSVHSSDGRSIATIEENRIDGKHPLSPYFSRFSKPEFGFFKNSEGVDLYYELIKPTNYREDKRYPLIVECLRRT